PSPTNAPSPSPATAPSPSPSARSTTTQMPSRHDSPAQSASLLQRVSAPVCGHAATTTIASRRRRRARTPYPIVRRMVRRIAMVVVLLAASACKTGVPVATLDDVEAPAIVVGIRHADGSHEVRTAGVASDGTAPDGDTVFELGSLTKTF